MAHRNIHYEASFEHFLRSKGWPYVAVDEAKKAIFAGASVKSFDFIVYSSTGPNLLVDVKGRKFPGAVPARKRGARCAWENWITRNDAEGLSEWEKVFGSEFRGVFVFAYWLQGPPGRAPFEDIHVFRQRHYGFVAVALSDYLAAARPRSPRWGTISVPVKPFREAARELESFL